MPLRTSKDEIFRNIGLSMTGMSQRVTCVPASRYKGHVFAVSPTVISWMIAAMVLSRNYASKASKAKNNARKEPNEKRLRPWQERKSFKGQAKNRSGE